MRWDRMTREEQREVSRQIARAERVAQGLPAICDDPVILAKVARIAAGHLLATKVVPSGSERPGPALVGMDRGTSSGDAA